MLPELTSPSFDPYGLLFVEWISYFPEILILWSQFWAAHHSFRVMIKCSPLDCKEIQPVNAKGNQSWIFIGRTDAEAEAPILWPPDVKNWLVGKDPDGGKDWGQEVKGTTEDEMVGWHHRHDGHEFEQAPGVGDGQGSLVCCSPWGRKELDTTEQLNWTELLPKSKEGQTPDTSVQMTQSSGLSWA